MARAFKCDICGEYLNGIPLKLEFRATNAFGNTRELSSFDLCAICADKLSDYIDSIMIDK